MKCDLLPENKLIEELGESKRIIEKKLDKPYPCLRWPFGKFNEFATGIARDVGYKALFPIITELQKHIPIPHSDPFAISRIVVEDNIAWFKKRMLIYINSSLSHFYLRVKKK
jgi:hypothetical protein